MIHLIRLSDSPGHPLPTWDHGKAVSVAPVPRELNNAVDTLDAGDADYLLFWHDALGKPPSATIDSIAEQPGDVQHAGLSLGQGGRPALMDAVHPTWMLQRDPPTDHAASSWRLSLRACLVDIDIWRKLGGLDLGFEDLDAASLELGHRWWRGGALLRHHPELLSAREPAAPTPPPSVADELRFLELTAGRFWRFWATWRAFVTGSRPRMRLLRAWRRASPPKQPDRPKPELLDDPAGAASPAGPSLLSVAVLIPTLDRYPYLTVVLEQLRHQTVPPAEIVVIDQTAMQRRRRDWHGSFDDLPLKVLEQDRPGQSTARNAGLRTLSSDCVLFLDDDVEIEPDLIARHLEVLRRHRADVSCGVTSEVGAGPLPEDFRRRRLSDVFPTCNCMARRRVLGKSGLFDLAFDHGSRADADLGTRIYLAGGLMVLEPSISVLHHKAPAGGLRQHGARVVTYADSRRRLSARHLPSATEIYLARRYFTPEQVREAHVLRIVGTLKGTGGPIRAVLKLVVGVLQLPSTWLRIRRATRDASALMQRYPDIPELPVGRDSGATP